MRKTLRPENTGEINTSQFKPGLSGNPKGRPRGALNKTTLAMQALLDGEAEALTRKAIELALGGDMAAIRLCIERLLPSRKDRPINLTFPPIEKVCDVGTALSALIKALATGEITPLEAATIGEVVELKRKAIETMDIEARLTRIEQTKEHN